MRQVAESSHCCDRQRRARLLMSGSSMETAWTCSAACCGWHSLPDAGRPTPGLLQPRGNPEKFALRHSHSQTPWASRANFHATMSKGVARSSSWHCSGMPSRSMEDGRVMLCSAIRADHSTPAFRHPLGNICGQDAFEGRILPYPVDWACDCVADKDLDLQT